MLSSRAVEHTGNLLIPRINLINVNGITDKPIKQGILHPLYPRKYIIDYYWK